jgi:Ca2+-binding RTX toxin-like protein
MPIPVTKLLLADTLADGSAYQLLPEAPTDFAPSLLAAAGSTWISGITDLNGDGLAEIITGAPGSDDKATDAGRVYLTFGQPTGGTSASLGDSTQEIIIDGLNAGDRAGAAVGSIADLSGDGRAEILVGAPGQDFTAKLDAGAGYALWGDAAAGGIDLGDPTGGAGNGVGYIIRGEAAGDAAGSAMLSIGDLNGDGRAEVLVSAPGSDSGGLDSGAAYVVFGKASDNAVNLTSVTAGTGGFRIKGAGKNERAGEALGVLGDQNADGKSEVLVGAAGSEAGGKDSGAVYVVFGKSTGTQVNLGSLGATGYRITGQVGEGAGSSVTGLGDVNGDGRADMLVGTTSGGHAYVVFGKAGTAEVLLSDVAAGTGGYMITPELPDDLAGMTVTGGRDLNRDGVMDLVIGTPHEGEGGTDAGAVYVVWGGGHTAVDLSLVAQGIGGAKIVGDAGSLLGSAVALAGDVDLDGTSDLILGAPGAGESVSVLYAPALWQPDANIYGTNAGDVIGLGYGGLHVVDDLGNEIYGLGGDDSITAGAGADRVDGGDGFDTIEGGAGDNTLQGSADDDVLTAGAGNDSLDGGTGTDAMAGGLGDDIYVVDDASDLVTEVAGEGRDTVEAWVDYALGDEVEALTLLGGAHLGHGNALDNRLTATLGNNALYGGTGADTLIGAAGSDSLDGQTGADSMEGGAGNDLYVVDSLGDVVTEASGAGSDTIRAALDWTLGANVEGLELNGAAVRGEGNGLANRLVANAVSSTLLGMAGNDTLTGGAGDDSLDGGTGADSMAGGVGNDLYIVENAGDIIVEAAGGGTDTVRAGVDHTLAAQVEALVLTGAARQGTGNALANTITGNDLGDTLAGAGGTDTLTGGLGADQLDGGSGDDSMLGGAGDDTYTVDSALDVVVEGAAGGTDTVRASVDYVLGAEIENLVLTAGGRLGTGNAGANMLVAAAGGDTLAGEGGHDSLFGDAGADRLDGGSGADSMAGGAGNDAYVVDDAGDVVTELAAGGTDTVFAALDHTLGANVEKLVLTAAGHIGTGNALANTLTGTSGADTLQGGEGADTLDGAGGGDRMLGGAGDDTYYIRAPGDVVVEDAAGGFDTVIVSSDWTLSGNIEAVQLLGAGHALTGNATSNSLSGNSGSDTLDGGGGDDTLLAGDGDDVLVVRSGRATMDGGSGDDRYVVHGGEAHIEDFLGDDTIDASDAAGGCVIDLSGDTTSSVEGNSLDFGLGGSTSAPLDVQFLQDLTGSFADDIVMVRGLVPQIVSALQAVQPNAVFGVSTFRDKPIGAFGGVGDWVYQQQLGLSLDTAALTGAYTTMVANNGADGPEAQIEALMHLALHTTDVGYRANSARFVILFTDAPFHSAGDGAAVGIHTPNNGDGVLDGTPAGTGEDYPFVAQVKLALEAANIIPIFAVAGGNDAAYQALVTQLGRGAEVTLTANSSNVVAAVTAGLTVATTTRVENAWGGAGDDVLTGSVGGNALRGNGGNDSLDGGSGADSLDGGAGNDTYTVDDAGDAVTELAGGGTDLVRASIDLTLAVEVEDLILLGAARAGTGNALANHLTGNDLGDSLSGDAGNDSLYGGAGADQLDGGVGIDRMEGKAGDDTYLVDNTRDVVIELAGGGVDTVRASVVVTLAANVENLVIIGPARGGTGNALANLITGNDQGNTLNGGLGDDTLLGGAGKDALNGGTGADSMTGGAGNDSYTVDDVGDVVVEAAAGGTDMVKASISCTLGADMEGLMLLGATDLTGTGNALANGLTGNAGANLLIGLEGNDKLDGGLGADTMDGGAGNDSYLVDNAGDVVTELAAGGLDRITTSLSWTLGDEVEQLILAGTADLSGVGNALANTLMGNAGANLLQGLDGADVLDGSAGADTMEGGAGNDVYTVDNLGDVVVEVASAGTDTVKASISYALTADVERLVLTGVDALSGTGNGLANLLTGNAGANLLAGLDGNDTITAGAGDDVLMGGVGADLLTGGLGADIFRFGSALEGADRITDFVAGTDVLEFSAGGFGGGLSISMDLDIAHGLVLGKTATEAHGQFLYVAATGALSWDADGTGAGAAQLIATLTSHPVLSAAELHIFG